MQDMRNDGFALKQNALGRVLNKDDPNQVIMRKYIDLEVTIKAWFALLDPEPSLLQISIVKHFMAKFTAIICLKCLLLLMKKLCHNIGDHDWIQAAINLSFPFL